MAADAVSLAVVGDVFPSCANFDGDGRALDAGFASVVELLRGADVALGNFELACSNRGYPVEKAITVRAEPARAAEARLLGLDVVSLANNHVMDYGPTALLDTIERLGEEGVLHVGAGRDLAAATAPVVVERNGLRIGFAAWSTLLPTGAAATALRPGLAPIPVRTAYEFDPYLVAEEPATPPTVRTWIDETAIADVVQRVAALRKEVDFLVVSVHWGSGITDSLAEYQRPLAHAFVEAGADIVAGNHPHAVHGIELHLGKPILYSPGLFVEQVPREGASDEILALYALLSADSYVALLDVTEDGLASLRVVPTTSEGGGGLPRHARGGAFDRIALRLREASSELGTEVELAGEGTLSVPLPAPVAAGGIV